MCSSDLSWKFSLSGLASFLITIFEFFGEKIRLLTVKQTRYPQNRRRKKYSDVIREANLKLAQQDSIFRRRGTIIDLTTEVNDYSTKCAFKIWVEIPGLSPTMAEIDSDSDINLISEKYFLENKDKIEWIWHGSEKASFGVIGSGQVSNYPPCSVILQVGGVKLSGK